MRSVTSSRFIGFINAPMSGSRFKFSSYLGLEQESPALRVELWVTANEESRRRTPPRPRFGGHGIRFDAGARRTLALRLHGRARAPRPAHRGLHLPAAALRLALPDHLHPARPEARRLPVPADVGA